MFALQKSGITKEQAESVAKASGLRGASLETFKREYGIVASAREKWRVMDTFKRNELVETGYQRVRTVEDYRYRTEIKFTVLDRRTGESYDTFSYYNHDRLLKRGTIEDRAWLKIPKSANEYLSILNTEIVGGYRSRGK